MKRGDKSTTTPWEAHTKPAMWPVIAEDQKHVALLSSRESISSNADDNSPRHFSTRYVQAYKDSQQNHELSHDLRHSTTNFYRSQHKNANNPFASALAEAFGIEEAYS
ncbi:MAG: hypothetical protein H0V70_17620 [Ktedonobacteraceae bacterium]|nr:hypothetical protein [Ktedonobacteraceae bacterium]